MEKLRVLYLLSHHPQISETYVRTEIEAVKEFCDVRVFSLKEADTQYKNYEPYVLSADPDVIGETIREFKPHVLHTHWLTQVRGVAYLAGYFGNIAERANIPFTV